MARNRIAVILSLCCGLALACSGVDLEADRRAILAADRAFSEMSKSGDGIEEWVANFATDGTMFPRIGKATGHDEIRSVMAPQFEVPGLELSWEPATVTVAASADYAYTMGKWRLENTNPLSPIGLAGTGNYVTIWRKVEDGSWKVMVNIGNLDPPPDQQFGQ